MTAAEALEGVDVRAIVHDLLKNGSRPVKLQTLTVLWDRIFGKPKQEIGVSGGLLHTHTRDPLLASLSKEALEELAKSYDGILAKHAPPVLEVAQDAPQNQTESKPAIEAEVMDASHSVNIYMAQVHVPSLAFTIYGPFAGVNLAAGGQMHRALIGRTFLQSFTMATRDSLALKLSRP